MDYTGYIVPLSCYLLRYFINTFNIFREIMCLYYRSKNKICYISGRYTPTKMCGYPVYGEWRQTWQLTVYVSHIAYSNVILFSILFTVFRGNTMTREFYRKRWYHCFDIGHKWPWMHESLYNKSIQLLKASIFWRILFMVHQFLW